MIDLEDLNRSSRRRLAQRERIESSSQNHVLLDGAVGDSIGEAVLSVTTSHYKARTQLLKNRLAGFHFQVDALRHLHHAQSDRVYEDLRFVVEKLINGAMDGRCLARSAGIVFIHWRMAKLLADEFLLEDDRFAIHVACRVGPPNPGVGGAHIFSTSSRQCNWSRARNPE